jgi:protein HOOK3
LDFGEAQKSYEAQIAKLKEDVVRSRTAAAALEKRYKLEQQLMLSAWHDLGSRTVREHVAKAGTRRSQPKPQPSGWLGRQRRWQEDATFVSVRAGCLEAGAAMLM